MHLFVYICLRYLQFYDLLNIFELNGLPSEENPYLFNGDFVDRGSFSLEVILTLFAFKCMSPSGKPSLAFVFLVFSLSFLQRCFLVPGLNDWPVVRDLI